MLSKWKLLILLAFLTIAGCAQPEASANQTPDYESTKKMMVDMLQTEEGKEAIKEIMTTDEELQQAIIMDQAFVRKTIQDTLTSEQGRQFWQETMKDPEFAKAFAESIQKENEELLKTLMKDPEYQEMMMIILKDPEMEKAALDLMQTKEYRQQVMTIMTEAFESPYFKAQVSEILSTVVQEQTQKPASQSGGEEGGSS
ncbi:spore germination lipoprotein GerD [Bacillus alkalicellulosilyticus]|uniref:spore germination lipoprotein GerD n=1 Tax=Alkalihalobacterium alkalicellulosilyticum TaxID=1912214 RepID=UPI0009962EF1|nr:spore germination lipoprotein GerD [Bacillus alkalicellulosilyticus]